MFMKDRDGRTSVAAMMSCSSCSGSGGGGGVKAARPLGVIVR